jgi:hypothetical protein
MREKRKIEGSKPSNPQKKIIKERGQYLTKFFTEMATQYRHFF